MSIYFGGKRSLYGGEKRCRSLKSGVILKTDYGESGRPDSHHVRHVCPWLVCEAVGKPERDRKHRGRAGRAPRRGRHPPETQAPERRARPRRPQGQTEAPGGTSGHLNVWLLSRLPSSLVVNPQQRWCLDVKSAFACLLFHAFVSGRAVPRIQRGCRDALGAMAFTD